MNEEFPGWLHEVNMGATTVWERWNSLLEGGVPNPDGMTSFNHYAYGSMVEFLYRRVVGIENTGIGFNQIQIMPHPSREIGGAYGEYNSVNGKIISSYKINGDTVVYEITVPNGVACVLSLPREPAVSICSGAHTFERKLF